MQVQKPILLKETKSPPLALGQVTPACDGKIARTVTAIKNPIAHTSAILNASWIVWSIGSASSV